MDTTKMGRNDGRSLDSVTGLRKIGVKDLSYKMVFIASSVHAGDSRFGFTQNQYQNDDKNDDVLKNFTF